MKPKITLEKLRELMRTSRKVRVGDTLYIGSYAEIEAVIRKALRQGKMVEEDRSQRWLDIVAEIEPNKSGSARYHWHRDGNRVRAEEFLVIKRGDELQRISQGKCWIKWEAA